MVRPPILPPSETASFSRVSLLHPGYGDRDNTLFSLFAVDGTKAEPGLHHRTILTAGAIITDNAFDRAYLTHDRAGGDRVENTIPLDGTLAPGKYWLQLSGHKLPRPHSTTGARSADGVAAANASMPPPSRPASAIRDTRPSITDGQTQPSTSPSPPALHIPYPIVASFGDWQFPHDKLPSEWKQRHPAPSVASSSCAPPSMARRCYITGCQMGVNDCHLVPNNQFVWWAKNGMRDYTKGSSGSLKNEANLALLRADIHSLFDFHQITIVPKPLEPSPPIDQANSAGAYAFAAHVLEEDVESCEFYDLQYHNVAISQAAVDRLSPEFLFARFAWAIFSKIQDFLSSPNRRHLTVTARDETGLGSCATESKWMNGDELTKFLSNRGVTRSGSRSRKRSSSVLTQDVEETVASDAYQERWDRRSRSFDSADTSSRVEDLEPGARQAEEKMRWYEEVGRPSRARDAQQEQIEAKTRWYEEVRQSFRQSEAQEQHEAHDSDEDSEVARRRPRGTPGPGSSPPGSAGMPNLSGSFTSSSNWSCVYLAEEDEADQGIVRSAITGDKILGAGESDPDRHVHLEEDEPFL